MRRLLVGTVVAALLLPAAAARAQTVFCANCTEELPEVLRFGAVAANWVTQLERMKMQYDQMVLTYESLHHLSPQSLSTAAGLFANRLPGSPAANMPRLNYGTGLSGAGQQFYDQNHYYTPNGDDFAAQEMQRRQYATANLQGEAQAGMMRIAERIDALTELQNSIPDQPDVTAVSAINARITSEKAFLANEANHIGQLQLMLHTQQAVDMQRAEQHSRAMLDQDAEALNAAAGWGN